MSGKPEDLVLNETLSQDEITCFRISETWRKHATPCFRYVYVKVVRFRCIRSNGNARKRHETGNGNTGYPSCFRNGLTCFCHASVYGFLRFCPVYPVGDIFVSHIPCAWNCIDVGSILFVLVIPGGSKGTLFVHIEKYLF